MGLQIALILVSPFGEKVTWAPEKGNELNFTSSIDYYYYHYRIIGTKNIQGLKFKIVSKLNFIENMGEIIRGKNI